MKRKERQEEKEEVVLKQKQKKEERCGTEAERKKKAETEKKKKGAALKLNQREGWNREFFSIYFPSNLLRKIMMNLFMLDLIFSIN